MGLGKRRARPCDERVIGGMLDLMRSAKGLSDGRRCVPQWTQFAASPKGHGDAICHHEGRAFVPHAGSRFQGAFRSAAWIAPGSVRTIASANTDGLFMASFAENQSPFSMAEWEEILRYRVQAFEERKREYLRWTATGLTAIGVLVGIVLQSIGTVRLGAHFYVSLGILFLGSYLTSQLVWELAHEKILLAIGTVIGEGRAARPWDIVTTPAEAAKVPLPKLAWQLGWSVFITIFVALGALVGLTPASGTLFQLAVFRIATILILGIVFFGYRSLKVGLPKEGSVRVLGFLIGKVLIVGYYGFQMWLATQAFLTVSMLDQQGGPLILIVLEGVGILSIGGVIWRIAWPLVRYNAKAMGILSGIHDGILSGRYPNLDAISVEVRHAYMGEQKRD